MEQIGVRELRQNASVYLERVKDGESIEITQRGVPIAVLSPAPGLSLYDRLLAEGRLVPPTESLDDWLRDRPAREPMTEGPTSGEILDELREERLP